MHDEERYPIATQSNLNYYDALEVAVPAHYDAPEVVAPLDYYDAKHKAMEAKTQKDASKDKPMMFTSKSHAYCGLKRRTFFIVLAIAILVIVAAVVGGVVGRLSGGSSSKDSSNSSDKDSDDPPSTTASGPEAVETGPIEASQRAVAASTSTGGSSQDVQVFYQDLDSTDIFYRRIADDEGRSQQTLDLDIAPSWGTPLAAAAINGSDPISVQVFYVAPDAKNDKSLSIVQATLECASDADDCRVKSNSVISSKEPQGVHADTKLAALRPDEDTIRVFYQARDKDIWVLNGDNNDWTSSNIVSKAYSGSGLAASGSRKEDINLFWVSENTGRLTWSRYPDSAGPGDETDIDMSPGPSWTASSNLAAVWVPDAAPYWAPYRVYHARPDEGDITAYFQEANDLEWNPNQDPAWGVVEGGLAAVAWGDQVRMYYFMGGGLVVSAQSETIWAEVQRVSGT